MAQALGALVARRRHVVEMLTAERNRRGRTLPRLRPRVEARSQGYAAGIVFVVQRGDALSFSPWDQADPAFGQALRQAAAGGVWVAAYLCAVSPTEVRLSHPVPVRL